MGVLAPPQTIIIRQVSLNNEVSLVALLTDLREGRASVEAVSERILTALREQPYEDLGFAKIDHHRSIRQGFPEVILGLGKSPDQVTAIAAQIVARGNPLLVTRAEEVAWQAVKATVPNAEYHPLARCITVKGVNAGQRPHRLCSAGNPPAVAEEATVTEEFGEYVERSHSRAGFMCGSPTRSARRGTRRDCCEGMEGARDVVAGMVGVPVIG